MSKTTDPCGVENRFDPTPHACGCFRFRGPDRPQNVEHIFRANLLHRHRHEWSCVALKRCQPLLLDLIVAQLVGLCSVVLQRRLSEGPACLLGKFVGFPALYRVSTRCNFGTVSNRPISRLGK